MKKHLIISILTTVLISYYLLLNDPVYCEEYITRTYDYMYPQAGLMDKLEPAYTKTEAIISIIVSIILLCWFMFLIRPIPEEIPPIEPTV